MLFGKRMTPRYTPQVNCYYSESILINNDRDGENTKLNEPVSSIKSVITTGVKTCISKQVAIM